LRVGTVQDLGAQSGRADGRGLRGVDGLGVRQRRTRFLRRRDLQGVRREYAGASDAQLLAAGDADAFAVLYDRHVSRLFGWARARVGEYAADLTAEVFARAWLRRGSFRDEASGSAFPWLYGIANNVLRDSLRKRRVEDRARAALGLPASVAPDPEYDRIEQRLSLPEAALAAIAELPPAERELLDLRVVQERSYREIAARLRCTPEAARLRVSRALRRLNLDLGGHRE
jgi:RNA polymerase sigma-70 factor (ECF subfamily)